MVFAVGACLNSIVMAEKKIATYDSIMRDLREGRYAPVYILMGEESYYIDKISSFIEDNAHRRGLGQYFLAAVDGAVLVADYEYRGLHGL